MKARVVLGWSLAIVLGSLYFWLFSVYAVAFLIRRENPLPCIAIVPIFALQMAIWIGCCWLICRFCQKRTLDSHGRWRAALLLLLALPIAWLMHDDPPLKHDYTMQDVLASDPQVLASYDTLMLLRKNGGLKVEPLITESNYCEIATNPLADAELIQHAWNNSVEVRSVFDNLDTYPGIADLTPQIPLAENTPVLDFKTLRNTGWAYAAYASLKTAEGNPEEAARHLAKIQSVARKALPYSTLMISKFIWKKLLENNLTAAKNVIRAPQCTSDTLGLLSLAFQPLSEDELSLRKVIIGENIALKACCKQSQMLNDGLNSIIAPYTNAIASKLAYYTYRLTFRKNHVFRDMYSIFDLTITCATQKPPDMLKVDSYMGRYIATRPSIRNMGGWFLFAIGVPSYMPMSERTTKQKVRSDLLFLEIEKRLGKTTVMQDYYSDAPYSLDEKTGRMFSVGPDEKAHTTDDITLETK